MASASLCGSVCVCVKLLFLCLLVCQFVLPLFHSRLLRYCLPLFRQSGAAFVVLYCTIVFNWSSAESATATVVILRYISVHIIIIKHTLIHTYTHIKGKGVGRVVMIPRCGAHGPWFDSREWLWFLSTE